MNKNIHSSISIPQHPLSNSVFYHLAPGLCILLFYLCVSPILISKGFNKSFGLMLSFLLIGIPLQLIILKRNGYDVSKSVSTNDIIFYKNKIQIWQYILISLIFIIYAIIASSVIFPISEYLLNKHFNWLPNWFTENSIQYDKNTPLLIAVISFISIFIIDGLINPIVEEVYFRGFLLPRISRFKYWAPLFNAILFSLAHYWQPWNILQIFILVLPLYYVVWWKRNIYISMIVHCLANLIGAGLLLSHYLSS